MSSRSFFSHTSTKEPTNGSKVRKEKKEIEKEREGGERLECSPSPSPFVAAKKFVGAEEKGGGEKKAKEEGEEKGILLDF